MKMVRVMVLKALGQLGKPGTLGDLISVTRLAEGPLRGALEILMRDEMVRNDGEYFLLTDLGERAQYVVSA